jgi:hypothetical protein
MIIYTMADIHEYLRDIDSVRRKIRTKFGIMEITKSNIEYYTKKHGSHEYFVELTELWTVVEGLIQVLLCRKGD